MVITGYVEVIRGLIALLALPGHVFDYSICYSDDTYIQLMML